MSPLKSGLLEIYPAGREQPTANSRTDDGCPSNDCSYCNGPETD